MDLKFLYKKSKKSADELSLYVLSNQNKNSINLQVDSIH